MIWDITAAIGLTYIIVYSHVFKFLREWAAIREYRLLIYLLKCCQCMGFWVGVFMSLIMWHFNTTTTYHLLIFPFISSICAFTFDVIMDLILALTSNFKGRQH